MGKKAPSMPPAPDPAATAAAQAAANKESAIATANVNRINQITPWGQQTYRQIGVWSDGTPRYEQTVTLSPEQQRIEDLSNSFVSRIGDATAQPFTMDQFGDPEAGRAAERDRLVARMQPIFDQQRESIEQRMINQGVTSGSEAYNRGIDESRRSQNDYYLAADVQAGQEAARNRATRIEEALLQRSQPINEMAAILGTSGGVKNPQFSAVPQAGVQPADVMGAQQMAYQGQLANFNAQNQRYNANLQGLYALGGMGLRAAGGWF